MDIHTGEVLAMTSLPQLNPNDAGNGIAGSALQPRHAAAFMSWVRPSSRSRWRWRWTRASSSRSARCIIARSELHVYGHVIHDTHPYGRACSVAEIMKESSNIGTAQIADQLGATRQKAFLEQDGLPRQGRDRTQGARADADAGLALGSVRNHDRRLWPRHRGHPAASGERLCDLVQRRHLPSRDPAQGRPGSPRRPGPPRLHRGNQLQDARACCGWW